MVSNRPSPKSLFKKLYKSLLDSAIVTSFALHQIETVVYSTESDITDDNVTQQKRDFYSQDFRGIIAVFGSFLVRGPGEVNIRLFRKSPRPSKVHHYPKEIFIICLN